MVTVRIQAMRLRRQRLIASNKSAKPASAEVRCPPLWTPNGEYSFNSFNLSAREGVTADMTLTMPVAAVSKEINLTIVISEKENLDFMG